MNAQTKFDYKIVSIANLVSALRVAYVAACKALGLANKLKDSKRRGQVMARLNKLRSELKKYDNGNLSIMESVAYRGLLINKF